MVLFFIFAVLIPATDQLIKYIVRESVIPGSEVATSLSFLKITYIKNYGAALGLFHGFNYFIIFISVIIILAILFLIFYKKINAPLFLTACSCIVGGGIGNLIDRAIFGYVTDYIKISFFPPVCNLSDYFLSIGVFIFTAGIFLNKGTVSKD